MLLSSPSTYPQTPPPPPPPPTKPLFDANSLKFSH